MKTARRDSEAIELEEKKISYEKYNWAEVEIVEIKAGEIKTNNEWSYFQLLLWLAVPDLRLSSPRNVTEPNINWKKLFVHLSIGFYGS